MLLNSVPIDGEGRTALVLLAMIFRARGYMERGVIRIGMLKARHHVVVRAKLLRGDLAGDGA